MDGTYVRSEPLKELHEGSQKLELGSENSAEWSGESSQVNNGVLVELTTEE